MVEISSLQPRRRDRIIVSHADRDMSVDRAELDEDKATKMHKEHRKRAEKENRDRKVRDHDDREPDNNRDFNLQRFDKKKSSKKAEGFGVNANFTAYDDKDTLKSESSCCNNIFGFRLLYLMHLYRWYCFIF